MKSSKLLKQKNRHWGFVALLLLIPQSVFAAWSPDYKGVLDPLTATEWNAMLYHLSSWEREGDLVTPGQNVFLNTSGGGVGINTTSISADLLLDVEGKIGASQFCDVNGANCLGISDITGGIAAGIHDVYSGGGLRTDGAQVGLEIINCDLGDVMKFDGTDWICDADSLGTLDLLSCQTDEILRFDGTTWACGSAADSDTLSGVSCAIGETIKWDGTAWGCGEDLNTDTLTTLSCTGGEIPKWNGTDWECAADSGGDNWGVQSATTDGTILGDGTGGNPLGVDLAAVQGRVTGTCPPGSSIRTVEQDGSVTCEVDTDTDTDTLATLTCGNGEIVKWNNGLGAWECAADNAGSGGDNWGSQAVQTGNGISGDGTIGNELTIDVTSTQGRVTGTCPPGSSIRTVEQDGSVTCEVDTDTDTDTLAGLGCAAGELPKWDGSTWICGSDDNTDTDTLATLVCGNGQVPKWNGSAWGCADDIDTDTDTNTDTLTTLGCAAGEIPKWDGSAWNCSVDVDTDTTDNWGAQVVQSDASLLGDGTGGNPLGVDLAAVQGRVTGTCPPGSSIRTVEQDGSVTCEVDTDTDTDTLAGLGCAAGELPKWDGSTWICGSDDNTDTDTLATLVCGNGQVPKWNGSAWGCADDIDTDTDTNTDTLTTLGCAAGEIPKWDGSAWNCSVDVDTDTTDNWGAQVVQSDASLLGDGTGGNPLGVDLAAVQGRVTGTCPPGSSIRTVEQDGSVTCEVDTDTDTDTLATLTCGNGEIVKWNNGLGAWECAADNAGSGGDNWGSQAVQTGNGISGDGTIGNELTIDVTSTQGRVTGTCPPGSSIRTVEQDGSVTCEVDTDTDTDTLAGLGCAAGELPKWDGSTWICGSDDNTDTDTLATLVCGNGQVPKWNGSAWGCADDIDTDTDTNTDTLTTLGCAAGEIPKWDGSAWNCSVDVDTDTTDNWGAQVVQSDASLLGDGTGGNPLGVDLAAVQGRVTGTCPPGSSIRTVEQDGSVTCEVDTDTDTDTLATLTCGNGEIVKWNNGLGAWECAADNAGSGGDNWGSQAVQTGNGISGDGTIGNELTIDVTSTQGRVTGTCPPGSSIRTVEQDGSVTCEVDTDTDTDTLAGLGCAAGELPKWDGSTWICGSDDNTDTDTLATLVCGNGQVPKWNGSAWGCADDIDTDTDTNTDTLTTLGCAAGEIPKWDGSAWNCSVDVDTDTTDNWGAQVVQSDASLLGDGTGGNPLGVDLAAVQGRVTGTCPPGSSIRTVEQDGSVTCEVDTDTDTDTLATLTCGNGEIVKWNNGLGAWECAADNAGSGGDNWGSQAVQTGNGISGDGTIGNELTIDVTSTQGRVTGTCPPGSSIRTVEQDGSVTCEVDTDTDTDTLAGLGCAAGELPKWDGSTWICGSDDNTDTDTLATLVCGNGQVPKWNGSAWGCADDIDTDTDTNTDTLTTLGCAAGEIPKWDGSAWNCSVDVDTDTTDNWGAQVVQSDASLLGDGTGGNPLGVDLAAVQGRVTGTCPPGSSIRTVEQDGSVTCEVDTDTDTDTLATLTCGNGEIVKWNNGLGAWECAADNAGSGGDNWGSQAVQTGNGISGDGTIGNELTIDVTSTQGRVTGTCPPGSSIRTVEQDGSVTCEVDTDTDTDTLAGLGCAAGELPKWDGSTWICGSDDNTDTDTLATLVCGNGQVPKWNGSAWGCADDIDTDTDTNTDTLTTLGCAAGEIPKWDGSAWNCSVDVDTDTTDNWGAQVVQSDASLLGDGTGGNPLGVDLAAVQGRVTGTCPPGSSIRTVEQDGSVTCEVDTDSLSSLSCSSGEIPRWDGSAWICASETSDTLSALSCTNGQVAKWNGSSWSCSNDIDTDTNTDILSTLNCGNGQVAKWNGSAWICAADDLATGVWSDNGGTVYYDTGPAALGSNTADVGLLLDVNGRVGATEFCNATGGSCGTAQEMLNDEDALGNLSCASGQLPKWNGVTWVCSGDNDTLPVWSKNGTSAYYNDGFIGIGTSSPNNLLTIVANVNRDIYHYVYNNIQTSDADYHVFRARGSSSSPQIIQNNDKIGGLRASAHDGLQFQTVGEITFEADGAQLASNTPSRIIFQTKEAGGPITTKMVIKNNGRIGIGTNSPDEMLQVIGNVKADAFPINSDVRLKEDVLTIDNALDRILELRGVEFTWKKTKRKSLGLIAQEVEKIFPELVSTSDVTGLKAVEYANLVAPIIESIKELHAQNTALQQEVDDLNQRIATLEELLGAQQ